MQTTSIQSSSRSTPAWGPAWLHAKPPQQHLKKSPEPASKPRAPTPHTLLDYSEQCWKDLPARDYEYLTGPRNYPTPCPWCGGRLRHSLLCDELRQSWELTMPFGKHKGKPLSEVPIDYLSWLHERGGLDAELQAAIESVFM